MKRMTWSIEGAKGKGGFGSKIVPADQVDTERAKIRSRAGQGDTVSIKVTPV